MAECGGRAGAEDTEDRGAAHVRLVTCCTLPSLMLEPEAGPAQGLRLGAEVVVSPVLSSRSGGSKLLDHEEPPDMASEVSGASGTPVLRAFKEGEGTP